MSLKGKAYIAGIYEHPTRLATDLSLAMIHAEVAKGALEDAGLTNADVDGYFCAGDAPGLGPMSMVEYMGLKPRHIDSTDIGGSSYVAHVGHAVEAIAAGKCKVALITLAGRPRAEGMATGTVPRSRGGTPTPDEPFEFPYGPTVVNMYAMCAMRHMHQYGTTSEQLAWIKVAASHHAQHNPHALLRDVVTVEDVVGSPMIADPLHRLDCCVITDGGGAIVVVAPEIAKSLKRPKVKVLGAAEALKTQMGGKVDLTYSGAAYTGPPAFAEAGVKPSDVKYVSIYDSFTITVLMQLEDLGFAEKGKGGQLVADGNLISGVGKLPFNTDGGGLCSNHPGNRGGLTKVLEAVRQVRGEAHPKVQVENCDLALAHGTGGSLGSRHGSATVILERE
ncbi:thiolase domain-containing protein [Vineibacter terrae]|uniref:Thiolase domain-containing protein n=1 Tax=Vineibacter terrae TaxID=2586908 RepID=A0A5C8PJZ0_9HYPH|nr:thiolase domain-containing protein [Vineibacter terrae]TXL73836.1 thiolase domain-containing protein [Vineibacter terrae]